jgi:hypothetical protein
MIIMKLLYAFIMIISMNHHLYRCFYSELSINLHFITHLPDVFYKDVDIINDMIIKLSYYIDTTILLCAYFYLCLIS